MRTRARVYRAFLLLYPPGFRRQYGDSMVQLYNDQLHGTASRGTWFRTARDLAISIPYEYWESFMTTNNVTRAAITATFTGVAVLATVLLGATIVGLLLMLLLAWQLLSILRMRGHAVSSMKWWHFVLGGVGAFVAVFVVFALPWPESWRSQVPGDLAFIVVMAGISLSIVLVVVGVLLGITQLATHRRSPAA